MLRFVAFSLFATVSAFSQTKTVYLTFDDGPEPGTTDVLDVLKQQGAHAAFFLTGSNAHTVGGLDEQAAIVKRAVAEGHELANHCYIHKPARKADYDSVYGTLATAEQRKAFHANYARNQEHFRARLGQSDFRFLFARLPGDGGTYPVLREETAALGMRHFRWNFEFAMDPKFTWLTTENWQKIDGVKADGAGLPGDGAVILFHDRHWAGANKEKLAAILTLMKEKGYTFGKLGDLKPKAAVPAKPANTATGPEGASQQPAGTRAAQ